MYVSSSGVTNLPYKADDAKYKQTVLTAFQQVEDYIASLRALSAQIVRERCCGGSCAKIRANRSGALRDGSGSLPRRDECPAYPAERSADRSDLRVSEMTAAVQLIQALGGGWDGTELPTTSQVTSKEASRQVANNP